MITAYFRQMWYHYRKPYKVYPIEKSPDGAYKEPEQLPKGKRDFQPKGQKVKKFPEENFTTKRHTLSIWV